MVVATTASALDSLAATARRRVPDDPDLSMMRRYLKILNLEKPLAELSVIHVAGTKGKGSTCAFSESILKTCGYSTGLFTSPHLIDVRERFRINGAEISESTFQQHFWWCWDMLKKGCTDDIPMPNYFRFLTLLAFKMFISEKVDVAILEVGLGGKLDPTNVVNHPDVCGITCLGFDHMEILGNTLPEIAMEKAGILKPGVPAVTVPQPEDAMAVIKRRARELSLPLQVVEPLHFPEDGEIQLGLHGDHQLINAALAAALCKIWIKRRGTSSQASAIATKTSALPDLFRTGLKETRLLGRAQVEPDIVKNITFYLDGAHSPESMEVAAKWFCKATRGALPVREVLLFNCMPERSPELLFPPLLHACREQGVHFHRALFPAPEDCPDTSWQRCIQRAWDTLHSKSGETADESPGLASISEATSSFSMVSQNLPAALSALRKCARENPSIPFKVLVTGSLHLVGNLLKLLKHAK